MRHVRKSRINSPPRIQRFSNTCFPGFIPKIPFIVQFPIPNAQQNSHILSTLNGLSNNSSNFRCFQKSNRAPTPSQKQPKSPPPLPMAIRFPRYPYSKRNCAPYASLRKAPYPRAGTNAQIPRTPAQCQPPHSP